jgi:glutamyl-tRNA synthetase
LPDATVAGLVPLIRERLVRLADATELAAFLTETDAQVAAMVDPAALPPKGRSASETADALRQVREAFAATDFSADALEAAGRATADFLGWKAGDLFRPVRAAVTGRAVSPPLFGSMALLGREHTLARVDAALAAPGTA